MSILVKHFVNNPRLVLSINNMELSEVEKTKLAENVIMLYHQKLLTSFLEKLEEEDKKLFVESLLNASQTETVELLRKKIADIESVVNEAILELEEKIMEDFAQIERRK